MSKIPFFNPSIKRCTWARIDLFRLSDTRVDAWGFSNKKDAITWSKNKAHFVPVLHVTQQWKTKFLAPFIRNPLNTERKWGILRGCVQVDDERAWDKIETFCAHDLLYFGSFEEAWAFRDYSFEQKFKCIHETPHIMTHYLACIVDTDDLEDYVENE